MTTTTNKCINERLEDYGEAVKERAREAFPLWKEQRIRLQNSFEPPPMKDASNAGPFLNRMLPSEEREERKRWVAQNSNATLPDVLALDIESLYPSAEKKSARCLTPNDFSDVILN